MTTIQEKPDEICVYISNKRSRYQLTRSAVPANTQLLEIN